MSGFKEIFTLDQPCFLLVRVTLEECTEELFPNYASAALAGCEALKAGAWSVEIIPK